MILVPGLSKLSYFISIIFWKQQSISNCETMILGTTFGQYKKNPIVEFFWKFVFHSSCDNMFTNKKIKLNLDKVFFQNVLKFLTNFFLSRLRFSTIVCSIEIKYFIEERFGHKLKNPFFLRKLFKTPIFSIFFSKIALLDKNLLVILSIHNNRY